MNRSTRLLLIILAADLLFFSCSMRKEKVLPDSTERIKVIRVKEKPVLPVVHTFGTLVYRSKADVYPEVEGRVERILVEVGDKVRKDQILLVLAKEKLEISRDQAAASEASKRALLLLAEEKLAEGRKSVEAKFLLVEKARAEAEQKKMTSDSLNRVFEHSVRLFSVGGVAEGELETVKANYLQSRIDLDQAEKELEITRIGLRDRDIQEAGLSIPVKEAERRRLLIDLNTRILQAERNVAAAELEAEEAELRRLDILLGETDIRSPLDGVVGSRGVEAGERAASDTLLFSIFDTTTLYAEVDVGEKEICSIHTGQKAKIRIMDFPVVEGQVRLVAPYLDPRTKSSRIKILLDNHNDAFRVGMFVEVSIVLGQAEFQISLPSSALLIEDFGCSLLVVRGGILFKVPVVTESGTDGQAIIREGIGEDEAVVEKPLLSYKDGMKVEAVE